MSSASLTASARLQEDLAAIEPPPAVETLREATERHLAAGAPLLAYDAALGGLQTWPRDLRLRQLFALSMARSGASQSAARVLEELVADGHQDEETLGLLARTYKDLAFDATGDEPRRRALALAFDRYLDAYTRSRGYWTGINAATMALLTGRRDEAAALARDVRGRGMALLAASEEHDYWLLATMGEAHLVLGEWTEAEEWYARAVEKGRGRLGDLVSTRRNARRIVAALDHDTRRLDALFDIPRVAVFAGHLIDRPDRASPRFPSSLEPLVRDAIGARVAAVRPGIGYASAANGGDLLFLESLASIGAESHVVLPYEAAQFREDSVAIVPDGEWGARFDRAVSRAAGIIVASEQPIGSGGMSFEYGFRLLDGTACIRADELETDLVCIALWDGEAGDGPGGTASAVEHWRRAGRTIDIIDLAALRRDGGRPVAVAAPRAEVRAAPAAALTPEIVAMLFADVRGFSRLGEAEMPLFIEHCLGAIAETIARAPAQPRLVNTWGDGLYLVLDDLGAAGELALALNDTMRRIDWRGRGFGSDLAMRVGLHAGPAYACIDPVTGRRNYIGAHVSRAARIEPIAPPGEVYASGAFAALARSEGVRTFRCVYVGQTPLAKGYGTFPTYVLRRR